MEIRRQHGWAQRAGLPLELISADEARELFPLMTTDGVLGAAYTPTDGQIDPARLCTALAAGRRAAGVRIAQQTRVVGFATVDGPHGRRVVGVRTDRGESSARPSSSAAGCTPPRSRRWWTCGSRWCRCRTSTW